MSKHSFITKQRLRLRERRDNWSTVRDKQGFKRPGSMNPHKSNSIKTARKKQIQGSK